MIPTTPQELRSYAIEQAGQPNALYEPDYDMEWHAVIWALDRVGLVDNAGSSHRDRYDG